MDRATSRSPAVQRALRNAQDLEGLEIEEASKDAGRPLEVDAVEMRGDWTFGAYVVDQKADTAQRHIGCAIRLRHLQVRNAGGERIDIRDAGYPPRVARYRRDRQWRLLDGILDLLGRNPALLTTVDRTRV